MKVEKDSIDEMIQQVNDLMVEIESDEKQYQYLLDEVWSGYYKSARNLLNYNTLRKHDIRGLQKRLKHLGLSRLANSNGHVRASLLNTKYILESLTGDPQAQQQKAGLSIKNGQKLQNKFAKELLGFRSKGRRVRIMVTQPSDTADDYSKVLEMVKNGMNVARVNCAHDNPEVWLKIIQNVKKAAHELGRNVKIAMDLAGPKIRTGEIIPGPKVKKFSPERDDIGNLVKPVLIKLVNETSPIDESEIPTLPVQKEWLQELQVNDVLKLNDTRGKHRSLKVITVEPNEVIVSCSETTYMGTGTVIAAKSDHATAVLEIPPIEQALLLKEGDELTIEKSGFGAPAILDEDGATLQKAHISCQIPEIFDRVKVGEPILFDDGKIEGKIIRTTPDAFEVAITRAKQPAAKLKAEKGINFPISDLKISGLTEKDKEDLAFIVAHADIVNFSFVNSKEDVEELLQVLDELGALGKVDIILKIETQNAYDNLAEILLTAMKTKYVGVMIARGDLAVETGWDKIGWVQKEIIGLCNAAHVPIVWATQVFENLAKKGLPSRAEITDATTGLKADCVMLNKGLYINQAIDLLHRILRDMEKYDVKNESMLPTLGKLKGQ